MSMTIKREELDRQEVDFSDVASGAAATAGASWRDSAR